MSRYMAGKMYVGREVKKEFDGETFKGWVTKYYKKEDLYHVRYEDDDEEDVDPDELQGILTSIPSQTKKATRQDHGASGSGSTIDRTRRTTRSSRPISAAEGRQPKPKVNRSKGPGSGKRPAAVASLAALPQSPPRKKAHVTLPKRGPGRPRKDPPPQAAQAEPISSAGPAAEAEAEAEAAAEPAAATDHTAEAAPEAEAAPVSGDGAGPAEPEAPEEAADAPPADAAPRQPDQELQGVGVDAVEEVYKDVDILRSHPGSGGRPGPPRFSMVVYSRGFLFLAGQIVDDTSAPGMDTYYGQAKQVLHQVGQLLEESGSSMERILQVAVHLRDIEEGADEFNQAWLEVMDAEHLPARTTVQAHLMRPDLLVEVTAIAAVQN